MVLAQHATPHSPPHRQRLQDVVLRVHQRQRVQQTPEVHVDVRYDGQVLALPACASAHTPTPTVEAQHDVVDQLQQTHRDGSDVHVVVGAQRVGVGQVTQLEGVDEVKAGLQRGDELRGRGEVATELFDEEHDIDGDGAVQRRGQRREAVLHLRVRR